MHVHFRVPGGEQKEDWVHGTQAAYAGGVTYVCDMPNNTPAVTTPAEIRGKETLIEQTAPHAISHGLYIGATENNLEDIIAADQQGLICGVKVYFGTSTGNLVMNNLSALKALMEVNLSVPIVIHAEDDAVIADSRARYEVEYGAPTDPIAHSMIRSPQAAIRAIEQILQLVEETQATNVHITHMTTAAEVMLIAAAKARGLQITCDVTPHHLFFTTADYAALQNDIRCNPPIREQKDVDALWDGLRNGTIDMVASDHAPHTLAEKSVTDFDTVPSGVPGVQTMLPLLIDAAINNRITWERLIEITSTNPGKRFNIQPRGTVIIDPSATTTITNNTQESKCGWTPFNGRKLKGRIIETRVS